MRLWNYVICGILASTSAMASMPGEEKEDLQLTMEAVPAGFDAEVYQELFFGGDVYPSKLIESSEIGAPVFEDIPDFLTRPADKNECPLSLFANKNTYTDQMGKSWYVIERSGSEVLQRVFANLQRAAQDGPDFVLKGSSVVRSTAFKGPYFGALFSIENRKHVGEPVLFQFTLYPFERAES